jgi:DNA topoisomerase-2
LINNIRNRLTGQPMVELVPYFEGFKGTVEKIEADKYLIKGLYERLGPDTIVITELPVGKWTMPYTKVLEEMMDGVTDKDGKKSAPIIKEFTSLCTEVNVNFTVVFPRGKLDEIMASEGGVDKVMKLTTTIKTSNIHMFNAERKLKKYEHVEHLIDDYFGVRYEAYHRRKLALIEEMANRARLLTNKARYVEYVLIDKIDLRRKTAEAVNGMMFANGFDKIDGDYKYLVKMPMDSVTSENVEKLRNERDETLRELEVLKQTTLEQMWLRELDVLDAKYRDYKKLREELQLAVPEKKGTKRKK